MNRATLIDELSRFVCDPRGGETVTLTLDRDGAWETLGALAAAERDALAAKVERVRALHHEGAPFVRPGGQDRRCSCGGRWPCPTIRALDESEANK